MGNKGPKRDQKEVAQAQISKLLEDKINALEMQEAMTMREVKRLATAGQHEAAKILSMDIARIRAARNSQRNMASQMIVIQNEMVRTKMNQVIVEQLKETTATMEEVHADNNPAQMQATLSAFAREKQKGETQNSMMADAFGMMDGPSASADAEDIYGGILSEIGLDYAGSQAAVSTTKLAKPAQVEKRIQVQEEESLESRLAALRM